VKVRLAKTFVLQCAHSLPKVPEDHKCHRIHGHNFKVEVVLEGRVDPVTGFLRDYADIQEAWKPIHADLDHRYLNDIEGLENPTSENICEYLWGRLALHLPELCEVSVWENEWVRCSFRGEY